MNQQNELNKSKWMSRQVNEIVAHFNAADVTARNPNKLEIRGALCRSFIRSSNETHWKEVEKKKIENESLFQMKEKHA